MATLADGSTARSLHRQSIRGRNPWNMRQKRAKAYRKLMAMYEMTFGFRQPYQVLGIFLVPHYRSAEVQWTLLVDSGMCTEAQDHKVELVKQLETVLQGKIKPSEQCTSFPSYSSRLTCQK
jgi:U3 small nucleolar RNA-associated protein 23